MLTVGQLIKVARIHKKLSQEDVASKLDVTKNYISLIENDKKDPSLNFLKGVAKILNIPPILLIWEKMDIPKGKTGEEKKISSQLERMVEEAQELFAKRALSLKR